MKKLKLLKDWKDATGVEYKSGSIIDADAETAALLISEKTAEAHDPEAETRKKQADAASQKAISDLVAKTVKESLEAHSKANPNSGLRIEVVRAPEDQGFQTLGEQLQAIKNVATNGVVDNRLKAIMQKAPAGLSEGVAADGGFLLQPQFVNDLFTLAHETGVVAQRCRSVTIGANSNSLVWNALDEKSRATGSRYGGIQAYWTAEAGTKQDSKPKFAQRTMRLEKVIGLFYATDELLQDSVALGSMVSRSFGEEIAFAVDDAIIEGTGAGQPLGILNSGCLISVAAESGQASATVLAENIEKMYARMWARSMGNAVWLINQDVWPQLFQLKHVIGTGGVPVFMPPNGLASSPFGTLMGRPILPIEQASTLGTVGDIMFVDLSQYLMIEKGGVDAASSIHVKFVTDETAFRFVRRVNGQPLWQQALTPFKGSNTQSPFIALATRS